MPTLTNVKIKITDWTVLEYKQNIIRFPVAKLDTGSFTEIVAGNIIAILFKDGSYTKKEELKFISKTEDDYILVFADWSCSLSEIKTIALYTFKVE